jgi:hypothetical protein
MLLINRLVKYYYLYIVKKSNTKYFYVYNQAKPKK